MRKKFIENQFSQIDGRKGQPNGGDDEQGNPKKRERGEADRNPIERVPK